MDPTTLAVSLTDLKSAELASKVQYALAAKMLQVANDQGAEVVKLIQSAAQGFDQALTNAHAATDPSQALDVYA